MDKNIKGLKAENTIIKEDTISANNENDIIAFLKEKQTIKNKEVWSKLDKTTKIIKVNEFIDTIFRDEQELQNDQCEKCKSYLLDIIDKKRLNKNKDLVYKDEKVLSIANFTFNKTTNKPNIACDKRASTLRLPDLKKINKKHNKTKSGNDSSKDSKKIIIKDTVETKTE